MFLLISTNRMVKLSCIIYEIDLVKFTYYSTSISLDLSQSNVIFAIKIEYK
jgi:hypothetical protein